MAILDARREEGEHGEEWNYHKDTESTEFGSGWKKLIAGIGNGRTIFNSELRALCLFVVIPFPSASSFPLRALP
jgi:hypothetical protein